MPSGEYEPNDSRKVTLQPNEPGKTSGWRARDGANETPAQLEPDDSRNVTEKGVPEPGAVPGWHDKEARGHEPGAAKPPRGVPQEGKPFSAEEAAAAKR